MSKKVTGKKIRKVLLLMFSLTAVLLVFSGSAFATSGGSLPWDTPLGTLAEDLTGPVAGIVSLIAIVGAGAMLLFGGNIRGFMRTAVYLVLVIGLVVGAATLLKALYSGASVNLPTGFLR
ncbi:MAG: TrbC/VirB2 family protein [Synergistaceae bacterium]|jgi:type IV secretion system protein VirB2|nr:TrbC/VirB2 family protein [Synergistaceae bacterium]